jgi:two-component system CheB/CheR fusion protein
VNTELQDKLEELSKTNNDMKNLLDSIEIPTIFLDNDLRIKRFTPHATRVINLIYTDIGRPLSHIVSKVKYDKLIPDAEEVLKSLVPREREVETKDERWYLMRMLPYRTLDNAIDGVVITFSDIHALKVAAEEIKKLHETVQEARDYAENIIDTVRESLVVLDEDLRIITANRAFYATFQVIPEKTEGELIYNLGNGQWDITKLRKILEQVIPGNRSFDRFEVEYLFPQIGRKTLLLNARRIIGKETKKRMILLAIENSTDKT